MARNTNLLASSKVARYVPTDMRALPVLLILLAAPLASVFGSSTGISGFSGNPATNGGAHCSTCHSGGNVPTVTLTGPATVAPNTVSTYTLEIRGGLQPAGGLDVSVTGGTLISTDSETQILFSELTHTQPRMAFIGGVVRWNFDWRSPLSSGAVTIYGAGNSVNLTQGSNGDNSNTATLTVSVGAADQGPGETSGETLNPLRVTALDPLTGDLTLGYESPCGATDNDVYYGPLSQVATYGYSGEVCAIGKSGSLSGFNPGSGSFFFVVVGADATAEGSYGRDGTGEQSERPPFAGNLCGVAQDLSDACDAP